MAGKKSTVKMDASISSSKYTIYSITNITVKVLYFKAITLNTIKRDDDHFMYMYKIK